VPLLLEQLQLYNECPVDGLNVLLAVNKFAESLIHLQLFLPFINVVKQEEKKQVEEWKEKTQNIPLLKLIKFGTLLCNTHSKWFGPFIQFKCPNLEQLYLYGDETSEFELKMLQQNCFRIAPKLKKIRVVCGMARSLYHNIKSPPTRNVVTRDKINKITI